MTLQWLDLVVIALYFLAMIGIGFWSMRLAHTREDYLVAGRWLYAERMAYAYQLVCQTPKMSALRPRGSIYLWVNVTETGLPCVEVADRLFEEAHVLTIPGTAFGESCEGYLRLAMTVSVDLCAEAFDRIARTSLFS